MRFLRRFAVVTLVVAVVTGIGLAWNHFDPASLIGTTPPRPVPKAVIVVSLRPMDLGLNSMFERVDWPYLTKTVVIEAGLIAIVVFLDRLRRRARRTWRAYARRYGERASEGADTGG